MIKNADQIKQSVSTLDIIRELVALEKRGANYLGLCPFHTENTPSFTVNPNRNSYKCFGCGESGDGFQFLMEYKGMTFPEAVEYAAKIGRVKVEYANHTNREEYLQLSKEVKKKKEALMTAMGQVVLVLL